MKTTASPHLFIATASLLGMLAFAAEGYATSPDSKAKPSAQSVPAAAPSAPASASTATKEPLPAEIAAKPATPQGTATVPAQNHAIGTPAGSAEAASTAAPAGDTVNLPGVVIDSPAPSLSTESVLTNKGAGAAARERQFNGDVDRALNSKTLPLVGKTPEERALAKEQEEKRLAQIDETKAAADALKTTEPAAAAELKKDAYDMSVRENSFNENLPPSVRRDAPR